MRHDLYMRILTAMFLFWNGARVVTYIPMIVKILSTSTVARSHSLLSWLCWVLSNATFALMLLERNSGELEAMFWLNAGNTMMWLIVASVILYRRFRSHAGWGRRERPSGSRVGTEQKTCPTEKRV